MSKKSFQTNVGLPSGTTIRFTLVDFRSNVLEPKLDPPPGQAVLHHTKFESRPMPSDPAQTEHFARWNPNTFQLEMTLRPGYSIDANAEHQVG